MRAEDFITNALIFTDAIAGTLPDSPEQYADEEHRVLYQQLIKLFYLVKSYRSELDTPTSSTRDTHVGESNYSDKNIQPWDIWIEYCLNPWDADIVKRIARTKAIPGISAKDARIQDYHKIQHICAERIDQISAGDPYYTNFIIPPWVQEMEDD